MYIQYFVVQHITVRSITRRFHILMYLALLHMLSLSVTRVYIPANVRPAAAPKPIERSPDVLLYSTPVAAAAMNVFAVSSLSRSHVTPRASVE